jgi:rRNA maturation protein Nop10
MIRKCKKCGRTTTADFRFCQRCGNQLPEYKAGGAPGAGVDCACPTATPTPGDPTLCGCCGGAVKKSAPPAGPKAATR